MVRILFRRSFAVMLYPCVRGGRAFSTSRQAHKFFDADAATRIEEYEPEFYLSQKVSDVARADAFETKKLRDHDRHPPARRNSKGSNEG
jgi:hypothetical protein